MKPISTKTEPKPTITVAWWNTSLAPRGQTRNSAQLRDAAAGVIIHLALEGKADFIALGEMSETDFEYMRETVKLPGWLWQSGVKRVGRAVYDMCYAYSLSALSLVSLEEIADTTGGRTLRVAQRVNLVESYTGKAIVIFASHWPSRRNAGEHHPSRDLLGIRLRDAARAVALADNSAPHIILLGDYNDEPFSRTLNDHLMASRDISYVKKQSHLFYNPFWSCLGGQRSKEHKLPGSYYWKQGTITRWLTLDQIIFSANFISGEWWRLCEKRSHLVDIPDLTDLVRASSSEFDHIPVCATIEQV